jgi:hypothetical protein
LVVEEEKVDHEGFSPEVLQAFLIKAEVVFEGQQELIEALQHLVREEFVLAVFWLKLARRNTLAAIELLEQVGRLVYLPICPHIQGADSVN